MAEARSGFHQHGRDGQDQRRHYEDETYHPNGVASGPGQGHCQAWRLGDGRCPPRALGHNHAQADHRGDTRGYDDGGEWELDNRHDDEAARQRQEDTCDSPVQMGQLHGVT